MFASLSKHLFLFALVALVYVGVPMHNVSAHDYTVRGLTIDHPWARPTPEGARIGAIYFKLVNKSGDADTLLSVTAKRGAATEIHQTTLVDNIAKMRPVEGGVDIAAESTVAFEPAGLHVMLLGLKDGLRAGEKFPVTLTFKNRGPVEVVVNVEGAVEVDHSKHKH